MVLVKTNPDPVALVLGAGGVLGFAHVGVLEVLDEEGFRFDLMVGSSIGAIVGAVYGSGLRGKNLEILATAIRRRHWMDFSVSRMGLVAGQRLEGLLRLLTRDKNLDDLSPPLVTVATDIQTGEGIVLTQGSAAKAALASSAMPGIFPPVHHQGHLLVDGAVVNRVPVEVARNLGAKRVVAVSLGLLPQGRGRPVRNGVEVILKSFDIMQREISRHVEEMADVHIQPAAVDRLPAAPSHSEALLEAGREAARAALPALRTLFGSKVEVKA